MMVKVLTYVFLAVIGILILAALIATPFILRARAEGKRMYAQYDTYTKETLAAHFQLTPHPISEDYRVLNPWKALKLFRVEIQSQKGETFKRLNTLDATIGLFMKMYTLLILPDYRYNLPMLSVDIIFIGGKRVFVIEVIDPARIRDDNLATHYEQMRAWKAKTENLEKMAVDMEWAKDVVTDFSIHQRADRTHDDLLFEVYKAYLNCYLEMAKQAVPLSPGLSEKVQQGMEWYVDTLLAKGGPAVNVFKTLLGPERQKEYVRNVMFGLD